MRKFSISLCVLCISLSSTAFAGSKKDECEKGLTSEVYDIRNYFKTTTEKAERAPSYNLTVATDLGRYAITVRPYPQLNKVIYQVVKFAGSDWQIEGILHRMVKEMPGIPRDERLLDMYVGTWTSDKELEQNLATLRNKLKSSLQADFKAAAGLPKNRSSSLRIDAIRALLITFLRANGVDEEERFFDARLSMIHSDLLKWLNTKEQIFFDYAIFSDYLGFEAEERAEQAQKSWRKIDTRDQESYQSLHQGIREKLIAVAQTAMYAFRDIKSNGPRVFGRVQLLAQLWRERNPDASIARLQQMARDGVKLEDVDFLLNLHLKQEPGFNYRERSRWRTTLRRFPDRAPLVLDDLTKRLRAWASRFSSEEASQLVRFATQGPNVEDVNYILNPRTRFFTALPPWARTELATIRDGRADLSNMTPFGMDVDHEVADRKITITLSPVQPMNGGGAVEGGKDETGLTVPFFSRSRSRGPSYDSEKDNF